MLCQKSNSKFCNVCTLQCENRCTSMWQQKVLLLVNKREHPWVSLCGNHPFKKPLGCPLCVHPAGTIQIMWWQGWSYRPFSQDQHLPVRRMLIHRKGPFSWPCMTHMHPCMHTPSLWDCRPVWAVLVYLAIATWFPDLIRMSYGGAPVLQDAKCELGLRHNMWV